MTLAGYMSRLFALTLQAAAWLVVSVSAQTVQPRDAVRIGYTEFPPYSYTETTGAAHGYSIDLVRSLMRDLGYRPDFVPVGNPQQMLDALRDGRIDVTTLLAVTTDRKRYGQFTGSLGRFETSLFVRKESEAWTAADLARGRIGAIAGSIGERAVDTLTFTTKVVFEDYPDLLVALLDGSIEAAVAPTEMFLAYQRRLRVDPQIRVLETAVTASERGLLVHPDRPDLLADLNAAISDLTPSDLQEIEVRWFGVPTLSERNWTWLIAGLTCALMLAFIALWWFRRKERQAWADNQQNALLIKALNQIDLSIVIYDAIGHAVHWNAAMAVNFPALLPKLSAQSEMPEVMCHMHESGIVLHKLEPDAARAHAEQVFAKMRAGADTTRIVPTADGRVFEAREFSIGPDLFASILTDVTDVERQAAQIRDQNAELSHAYDRMQRFSSLAAHDLRAPLNQQAALMTFLFEELVESKQAVDPDVLELMADARTSVERMRALVEDLLTYARTTELDEAARDVGLEDAVAEALALTEVPAGFRVVAEGGMPSLHVPPTACGIVLRNLVSNALKHHDKPIGNVWISAHVDAGHVTVDVSDDGPGVPEQFCARIFEPFERLPGAAGSTGSGLGLAMVAGTVAAWGGELDVLARDGGGSIFRFTAPAGQSHHARPPLSENVVEMKKSG